MFTEWNKAFDRLRHRHDTWYVFRDFLDIVIDGFTIPGFEPMFKNQGKYTEEEMGYFNDLFRAYIGGMGKALETRDYFDFLGEWWESDVNMTNKFKAQFFTPIDVCMLMEELTINDDMTEEPQTMYDCCCGSGRFGLVHHHLRPQDYFFFNDLDDYAVKMTIVNMIMHGMRGVVAHQNTLTGEVFWCCQVTPFLFEYAGLPYVVPYGTDLEGACSMLPRNVIKVDNDKEEDDVINDYDKEDVIADYDKTSVLTEYDKPKGLDQWIQ